MSLFTELGIRVDAGADHGALLMAGDEAMLRCARRPVLRIYRWAEPTVSFGYFIRHAQVAASWPEMPRVRRWTGGGVVAHGKDVTFSLAIPAGEPTARLRSAALYAALHEGLRDTLQALGHQVRLARAEDLREGALCFAAPVAGDLIGGGRKIAGGAHRRCREGLLHQGSLSLPVPPEVFAARFAAHLAGSVAPNAAPPEECAMAEHLAAERYAAPAWTLRY